MAPTQYPHRKGGAAASFVSRSWLSRLAGMVRRNPWTLFSLVRHEFSAQVGSHLNRRWRPEWSPPPSYISLSPTRRCNLKCRMCIQHRHVADKAGNLTWYQPDQELPLAAWEQLFEELTTWRPIVFVTGGEPLLYPDILGFLEAAKRQKLLVHLQTNGVLLERVAQEVVALGVEMVTVSLDGPQAVHDAIRGRGTFARSVQGFQALTEARRRGNSPGPLMDIRCTISRDNLGSLPQMVEVAQEVGADLLQFTHTIFTTPELVARHNRQLSPAWAAARGLELIPPSIPDGEYYESQIGAVHLPLLKASLRELRRRAQGRVKVQFSPGLPLDLVEPYYLDLEHPFPQVCKSLWRTCRLLPDGTVSPCLHLVMGNITTAPLLAIWNNARMRRWRQTISEGLFPGCVRCCHRGFS